MPNSVPVIPELSARVSACIGVAVPGGPDRPRISEAMRVLIRRRIGFLRPLHMAAVVPMRTELLSVGTLSPTHRTE
jgi:hypothetical protein